MLSKFTHPSTRLPAVIGIVDGSVTVAYALGFDPINWHAGTLCLKLLLVLFLLRGTKGLSRDSIGFFVSLLPVIIVTTIQSTSYLNNIRMLSFALHALLTLMVVKRENIDQYLRAFSCTVVLTSLWHISQCLLGTQRSTWGRYSYLGGTHPNLGGEIDAVTAFAAAWSLKRKQSLVVIPLLIADELFMQSRSAILASTAALAIVLVFDQNRKVGLSRAFWGGGFLFYFILAVVGFGWAGLVGQSVSDALLIDDPHRGMVSGGSGRAAIWDFSIKLFQQKPLFGYGQEYLDGIGYSGAHNIVLIALVQSGVIGLIPLGFLCYLIYSNCRVSSYRAGLVIAMMPLVLFNDRFININPYPFVLYIALICGAGPAKRSLRSEPSRISAPPAPAVLGLNRGRRPVSARWGAKLAAPQRR